MRDRQKIEALLARRFPGSTPGQIAAAANAIMALDDPSEKLFRSTRVELEEFGDAKNGAAKGDDEDTAVQKTIHNRRS
ncbi:MAG TPA: hypothetical protein VH583_02005 [Vicinamibacterales bacterium]